MWALQSSCNRYGQIFKILEAMYVSPPVSSSLREEAPATRISLKIGIIVVMSVLKKAENEFCNRNIDFWIPKAKSYHGP